MLHRIVKLTLREDAIDEFMEIFNAHCEKIRAFPGCNSLQLHREMGSTVFFTYSLWDSDEDLQKYRKSELFGQLWPPMKKCFGDKPLAWSTEVLRKL